MSDPAKPKRARAKAPPTRDVLSNLPAHRPQRVTARRAATRKAAELAAPQPSTVAGKGAGKRRGKPAPAASEPAKSKPARSTIQPTVDQSAPAAPRQGFESEEILPGVAVQPPSATEMLGSALELAAGLAQGTLTRGGRLLGSALGRLPRI